MPHLGQPHPAQRLRPGIAAHPQRGRAGELAARRTGPAPSQRIAAGGYSQPGAARQRRYHWQGADQLLAIDDSLLGDTRYAYDALGYLTSATYSDGTGELRQADAVGNFFRTASRPTGTTARAGNCARPTASATGTTRRALNGHWFPSP